MLSNGSKSKVLDQLYETIESRRNADSEVSYTAKLLKKGRRYIAKKTGEEAVEVVIAAVAEDRSRVVEESADLLYHLLVLWSATGVKPEHVWLALARREGISGIEEKRSRRDSDDTITDGSNQRTSD